MTEGKPAIDADSFALVRSLLRRAAGVALGADKGYLVESRVGPIADERGVSLVSFLADMHGNAALQQEVLEALLNHETSFFRDWHPFETLRSDILPELIERLAPRKALTIWCAACSSGQEPYSLAILLKDHFPRLRGWDVTLLASDISPEVLERARRGRYKQLEIGRGLPTPVLLKYFRREGLEWQLDEDIRNMVEFRQINLTAPWPPLPRMDLILLRNVLIYFAVPTKMAVLRRARGLLRPEGCLVLGGAETTILLDPGFEPIRCGKSMFFRPCEA